MKINKILTIIGTVVIGVFLFFGITNSASVCFPYQGCTGTGAVPSADSLLIGAGGGIYGVVSSSTFGGTYFTLNSGVLGIASGYDLPLTASTTNFQTSYDWGDWSGEGFITNSVTTLSSLTSIGTIGTGAWEGTAIADAYISSSTEYLVDTNTDIYWTGTSDNLVAATGRTSLGLGSMALLTDTGSSSITTVGTIGTGTWNATAIDFGTYTNATCGTNCTLSNDEISVDDAFLKNDATDVGVGLSLTGDNSATSTAYVPMVLYDTTSTPPAASGFPHGTIFLQYTP